MPCQSVPEQNDQSAFCPQRSVMQADVMAGWLAEISPSKDFWRLKGPNSFSESRLDRRGCIRTLRGMVKIKLKLLTTGPRLLPGWFEVLHFWRVQ